MNVNEIDLKDFFIALWKGKFSIVIASVLFAFFSTVYGLAQPNVYQTNAILNLDPDPFGFVEVQGGSLGQHLAVQSRESVPIFSGESFKSELAKLSQNRDIYDVIVTHNNRTGEISLSYQANDASKALSVMLDYVNFVNAAYKRLLLSESNVTAVAIFELLNSNLSNATKASLEKRYAQELLKGAILESSRSELIQVVKSPTKPLNHISPKRILLALFGFIFGGMVGIAIVLIRFNFIRHKVG